MEVREKMAAIVQPFATVSDRIRALHAAGYRRAEIATFLDKRYQHVRNVLVEDERRVARTLGATPMTGPGLAESPAPPWSKSDSAAKTAPGSSIVRLEMSEDGTIRLPPEVATLLGYRRGGMVIAHLRGNKLELLSTQEALRQAQQMVRDLVKGEESMADSLIADRRREAAAEDWS